jgi:predicted PurR-regulated permease PerM
MSAKRVGDWVLLAGLGVILYFCFRILQPFLMPIFVALILSTLLAPVYSVLEKKLHGRRSLAALLVCLALAGIILVPLVFLSVSLANEANDAYQRLKDPETLNAIQSWLEPGGSVLTRIQGWLPASIKLDNLQLSSRLGAQAQQIGVAVLAVATTFATGIFNVLIDYFMMSIVLFFLLRDFEYFASSARLISPLSEQQEGLFVERFRAVTRATVLGNLATALTQGALSGLIFLILGLPSPVLWGALTALLSLVPLVGTALIWVPWSIYLFATGSPVKAVVFLVVQIVVVGGVDNILRPMLIEGSVKMHTLLVFFSILGGIGYFGILGMFFGPLIFAIAVTLLEFYVMPPDPLPSAPVPAAAPPLPVPSSTPPKTLASTTPPVELQ